MSYEFSEYAVGSGQDRVPHLFRWGGGERGYYIDLKGTLPKCEGKLKGF